MWGSRSSPSGAGRAGNPEGTALRVRFIASLSRYAGGTLTYTLNLADALQGPGVPVVVQSDRREILPEARREYVLPVWERDLRFVGQNTRAARRSVSRGEEVIHLQHEFFLYGGPGTALLFPHLLHRLRRLGCPLVTTLHGVLSRQMLERPELLSLPSVPPALLWPMVSRLQRRIVEGSDAVIVHDRYFRDRLVKECGASPERIRVIPHGVRTDLSPVPREVARARLGLPPEAQVLLSFGFLARYKGVEVLLQAFDRIAPRRPELQLMVAGGAPARGPGGTSSYPDLLQREVLPPLRERCRFTGRVPEEQVPDHFGAADLVVLTHRLPLAASGVLALAQGFGKPVVAPAIPPFLEAIGDPECLYDPGSSVALGSAIERALDSPSRLRAMAEGSQARGRQASWGRVAEQHRELYSELLRARTGA